MQVRCRDWLSGLLAVVVMTTAAGAAEIDVEKVCAKAQPLPLPSQDQPTAAQRQQLAKCDAEDLYYGLSRAPDPIAARLCAYTQLGADSRDVIFGGAGILMMIYAKGEGVPSNLDLARRFTCEYGGSEAELELRLKYLSDLQTKRVAADRKWDICDDITSGLMDGYCAAHDERFAARNRKLELTRLTSPSQWTPAQAAAFENLKRAADAFVDQHVQSEVSPLGSSANANSIRERTGTQQAFIDQLRQLESGKFPSLSAEDFRRADATLNVTYGKLMKATLQEGTITTKGVRETQRAWLKYRDAWVQFGAVKYPRVTADALRASLTRAREATLRQIYDDYAE